ncbi:MAG: hypothetical protein HRF45_08905 [Fimbriimonadia bacterium]|jgi:hypothetical protein
MDALVALVVGGVALLLVGAAYAWFVASRSGEDDVPIQPRSGADEVEHALAAAISAPKDRHNREALVRALLALTPEDARLLSPETCREVAALLNSADPAVLRAAVVAVGQFGGEQEVAAVRRAEQRVLQIAEDLAGGRYVTAEQMDLAEELGFRPERGVLDNLGGGLGVVGPPPVMRWEWPEDLPLLARRAREAVEARAMEEEERRTLLMAADDAGEAANRELLRPAAGLEDPDPEHLARPDPSQAED